MKPVFSTIAGLTLVLFAAAAMGQDATRPAPAVAVVNIKYVFDHIDEKVASFHELETMSDKYNAEDTKRKGELEKGGQQLNELKPDSPDYTKLQDELLTKAMELQAFEQYVQQKLQMEQRLRMQALYNAINNAVAQYAKANGITLVLETDDPTAFNNARTPQEMELFISNRKVLYADERYDITNKVVEAMNAAFALRGGTTPPRPAAGGGH